jgi:hypothetical protein
VPTSPEQKVSSLGRWALLAHKHVCCPSAEAAAGVWSELESQPKSRLQKVPDSPERKVVSLGNRAL